MANKAPFVDLVVGTHMVHALPDLLEEIEQERGSRTRVATDFMDAPEPVEIPQVKRGTASVPTSPSWKAATNIAAFVLCPTLGAGKETVQPQQ